MREVAAKGFVAVALVLALASAARAALGPQGMSVQGMSVQGMSVQGMSVQGMSVQGMSVQGMSVQGMSVQGMSVQGMSVQGMSVQGMSVQGMSVQGMSVQGMSVQGMSVQGMSVQGMSVQGMSVQGMSVQGVNLSGLNPDGIDPRGRDPVQLDPLAAPAPAIDPAGVLLQAGPGDPAAGDFIQVPGLPDASGTFWRLDLQDQSGAWVAGIPLYVAAVERDQQVNLSSFPSNDDVWLYTVYYRVPGATLWTALCPDDAYGQPHAMAVPGPNGDRRHFSFACTASGVAAKCARVWGYKWWKSVPATVWNGSAGESQSVDLRPFWQACTTAARADYCQDDHSFTREGTLVDLYDSLDGRTSIQGSAGWAFDPGAPGVMLHEEYQLSVGRTVADLLDPGALMSLPLDDQALVSRLHASGLKSSRYADLDPGRACAASPWIDRCAPEEPRACFASHAGFPQAASYGAIVGVNSPRYCAHPDDQIGEALDPLCNACVSRVCAVDPRCCGDRQGQYYPGSVVWGKNCVDLRNSVCRTRSTGPVWPPGRAAPAPAGAPANFRSGAVGAVLGFDDAGQIQGWACDPDLPGANLRVRASVGPPVPEGALLATAADLPVVPAWAAVAAAACGGGAASGSGAARHGFALTPPAGSAGQDIYLYALDASAPAAPATLIGRVRVPRCAHGELTPGAALDPACSACAAGVCADDPSCCAGQWTSACVARAAQRCANRTCAHAESATGPPLAPSCSACAGSVCQELGRCCTQQWDAACVDLAAARCAPVTTAAAGASPCAHDERLPGGALAATCSACAAQVCADQPTCCTSAWSPLCAARALATCARRSCAHAEDVAGGALAAACSGCAARVCAASPTCCSDGWNAACAGAAAATCSPLDAPVTPGKFDVVWSGFLEAPANGDYRFDYGGGGRALVVVNGRTVASRSWPGVETPASAPASLLRGIKYPIGIFYLSGDAALSDPAAVQQLSWTPPGQTRPESIGPQWLYPVDRERGNGLTAKYYGSYFPEGDVVTRTDAAIDFFWPDIPASANSAGSSGPFSIRWTGQLQPARSDTYQFLAQSDGLVRVLVDDRVVFDNTGGPTPGDAALCAHAVCEVGGPLSRACPQASFCADRVCARDPFCCYDNWDAHCVDLVAEACPINCSASRSTPLALAAGVKVNVDVLYQHTGGAGEMRLYWEGEQQHREIVPASSLFASLDAAAAQGVGLSAVAYDDLDGTGALRSAFTTQGPPAADWGGGGAPDWPRGSSIVCGPANACPPTASDYGPPSLSSPRDGASITEGSAIAIAGQAARGAAIAVASDGASVLSLTASAGGGDFSGTITLARGRHLLTATEGRDGKVSGASAAVAIQVVAAADPSLPAAPVITAPVDGQAGVATSIPIAGTTAPNAAVIVSVDQREVATLPTGPGGGFTDAATLSGYGWHTLGFTTLSGGRRSASARTVRVGVRPPRLTVRAPVSGTVSSGSPVAYVGTGVPGLGPVTIADGFGSYYQGIDQAPTDAAGGFAGVLTLDVGQHELKFYQVTPDGLGSDAVPVLVGVQPQVAPTISAPAGDSIGDSPLHLVGRGTSTPLPGAVTIYDGDNPVAALPLSPAVATFDGSVGLPPGWRWISATQSLPSLSGAGSTEGPRSPATRMGVRPPAPQITSPLNGTVAEGQTQLTVRGGAMPGTTVTVASDGAALTQFVAGADGAFGGSLALPNGSQHLTAVQIFDGIASHPSAPVFVAVGDIRPPSLTVPAHIQADADHAGGATVAYAASARDLRDGTVVPVCAPASGSLFPLGTTVVSCTATDAAGNVGTGSFTVFVRDPTPPTVTPPGDLVLEATGPTGAIANFQASAQGSVGDCAGNGTASCGAWKAISRGINCGPLYSVAVDPTNSSKVYTAAYRWVYHSSDGGKSWALSYEVTPYGSIYVSPVGEAFVAETRGIFKSADGAQWTLVISGDFTNAPIAFAPAPGYAIYSAMSGGVVVKSQDGGATWAAASDGLPTGPGQYVLALAVDPQNPQRIFASNSVGLLFRSDDAGQHWSVVDVPSFVGGQFIAMSPHDSNLIFTTTAVSRDGGLSWARVSAVENLMTLSFDPARPSTLYAVFTGDEGLRKSTDAGRTWERVAGGILVRSIAFDPHDPNVIFTSGSSGIFFSRDAGASWSSPEGGLVTDNCRGMAVSVSARDSRTVYAGFENGGLYRSVNGGDDWTRVLLAPVTQVAVEAADSNVVWVGTEGSLVKTFDGGATWGTLLSRVTINGIALDPISPDTAYVAGWGTGIQKTDDGGLHWRPANAGIPDLTAAVAVMVDAQNPSSVFSIFRGLGAFRSQDRGETWTAVPPAQDGRATGGSIAIDTSANPSIVYLRQSTFITGGTERLFRSDDGGETFTEVPFTTSCPNANGGTCPYISDQLAIDQTVVPSKLYMAFAWGLMTSTDRGQTWNESAFFTYSPGPVAVSPLDGTAYAIYSGATSPTTVAAWRTTNAGDAPPTAGLVKGDIRPSCSPPTGSMFAIGDTTVRCAATDALGQTTARTFSVHVADTTPPDLIVPPDQRVEASNGSSALVSYISSAVDLVDGAVAPACTPASGASFPLGSTVALCVAADRAGNAASRSFRVTVGDVTVPVVTVPPLLTAEATSSAGAAVSFDASASDAGVPIPVECLPPAGSTFAIGATPVVCSAQDRAGNRGSATFVVTVRDAIAPAISVPAPITVEATQPTGAAVTFTADALDAVDGAIRPSCTPGSGSTFPLGVTVVSCVARDRAGNAAAPATFTVSVTDTQPPSLRLPANLVAEAEGLFGAHLAYPVSADDAVGVVSLECAPASSPAEPALFPLGVTSVICTAADVGGHLTSGSFTVSVVDTTPPQVFVPAALVLDATSAAGAAVAFSVSAADRVDGAVAVACSVARAGGAAPVASGDTLSLGPNTVTCRASDTAGNLGQASFQVTVRDTTPPAFSLPSPTVTTTSAAGAVVVYQARATDAVNGPVPVACTPASGAIFPIGTTSVACVATDAAGNQARGTFAVTVRLNTPPVVVVAADMVVEATSAAGAMVVYQASASDAEDGVLVPNCTPASGNVFPLGSTPVSCAATDRGGLTTTRGFTIGVRDTLPPRLILPSSFTVDTTGSTAIVTFAASAEDLVSGSVPVACTPPSGASFPVGSTDVVCAATDQAGNRAAGAFTVTVRPTNRPPVVVVPANLVVEATSPVGATVIYTASASDPEDGALMPRCTPASGLVFALGTTTVTCDASDRGGLRASKSFPVTVRDATGPVFAAARPLAAFATTTAGAVVTYTAPVATDAVDGIRAVTCTPASGARFPLGPSAVTCRAADSGNRATTLSIPVSVTYQAPTDGTFFLPPIRPDGTSVFPIGRPIPVRFQLTGASRSITNATARLTVTRVSSTVPGATNSASDATVADTVAVFHYLPALRLYELRWRTTDQTQGIYRLDVALGDGADHHIQVALRVR